MEEPQRADTEDGRTIGPDPILNDRALLSLHPSEQEREVQDRAEHQGDLGEGDGGLDEHE